MGIEDLLAKNVTDSVRHILLFPLASVSLIKLKLQKFDLLLLKGLGLGQLSFFVSDLFHHEL